MRIGGNVAATLQQKATDATFNAIGERVSSWFDLVILSGWLDLTTGDSKYTHNAKLQDSTHVFLCDYAPVDRVTGNKRLVVNGNAYDVLLIDDPMEMHQHLEIYLKLIGGV